MLDARLVADRGVPPGGDVADRVDVAGALHQAGDVAAQPVLGGYPKPGEPPGVQDGAHTDHAAVGPHGAAVGQPRGDAAVAVQEALEPSAAAHGDPVVGLQLGAQLAHPLAENPGKRRWQRLQHGHLKTGCAGGGGDFSTDEAGPDHQQ